MEKEVYEGGVQVRVRKVKQGHERHGKEKEN